MSAISQARGGPAAAALLADPVGVAVDTAGVLYISGGGRIRKVSPDGIITTIAGGFCCLLGDGGISTKATLLSNLGIALDAAGNIYVATRSPDRIRKIFAAAPPVNISPATLNFSATAGSATVAGQQINLTSSLVGLHWQAKVATEDGGNWLIASPLAGQMPATLTVAVDATDLIEGTYRGTVTIQIPTGGTQAVTVQLTVGPGLPAQLTVEPPSLSFEARAGGGNPAGQVLRISNAGAGALNWAAQATAFPGGDWLRASPPSGIASAGRPDAALVTVNLTGLAPGLYSGEVQIQSTTTSQTVTVPVLLLLAEPTQQTILVSQSGLLFTGVEGGGLVPSQSFGVLNTGQGIMNWTVQASTLSGGNWLSVPRFNGSSDAASTQVPLVDVGVNVAGLSAGRYSGLIRVSSPGARNSPQFISVDLNVLLAGTNPGVLVRPTGLIFATRTGTSSPRSQTVGLATAASGTVAVRGGTLTLDGGDWLEAAPQNLLLGSTDPKTITVQPSLGSLAPGVYRGIVTLLFGDGTS